MNWPIAYACFIIAVGSCLILAAQWYRPHGWRYHRRLLGSVSVRKASRRLCGEIDEKLQSESRKKRKELERKKWQSTVVTSGSFTLMSGQDLSLP